ncbi:Conserved_hypothetical protein [Hexamita inflata]|uniref:BEACH domain-containing protein n=1 Tax=Hexamita inflata TaxID=28002 RepID=A0AA86QNB8_9EUKA|nr:Conserved hypothetical protein [Hexamita inflata]
MKRRVCLDEAIRQQISKQFNQDEVSEQLYKLSNAPYFRGAFELSLLKNKQELLEYLSEYPDTMLNEQGILADIYTNDLVIDEISINTNLLTQMQKLQPYQLILPFEYENKYYTFAQPAPLGQLLRYSPECLTSQLKLSLITDAAHLINTFHQVNQSYGSDFNIENSYVNLKTGTLKIAFPQLTSSKQPVNQNVTHLWITNQITNFQYIKYLNLLSGRRHSVFHSPFYPWVWDFNKNELRDPNQTQYYVNKGGQQIDFMFQSQALDASDTLSHTLSQYLNLISSPFDVKIAEPHHVGGPGVTELTLFCYLARRTPLKLLKKYVRPRFVAKQYCETIQSLHSWTPEEICAEYYTDYRVFTTDFQEFKTDPEFEHIFNSENILKNVELNGMTAKDFVTWHLDQLNSYPLLHNWLDLVFGPQHSGIRAFSCGNQPMSQTLQPFGMLNESYKMFTETHPIKLQDIDYLKDNKIHSVVTIDGNIRKDSQVNDDFDPLLQAHIMRQTKIQSQFSILTSFVPRFASQMSKLGYQYSLDIICNTMCLECIYQNYFNFRIIININIMISKILYFMYFNQYLNMRQILKLKLEVATAYGFFQNKIIDNLRYYYHNIIQLQYFKLQGLQTQVQIPLFLQIFINTSFQTSCEIIAVWKIYDPYRINTDFQQYSIHHFYHHN